jgi:hypothetical protein
MGLCAPSGRAGGGIGGGPAGGAADPGHRVLYAKYRVLIINIRIAIQKKGYLKIRRGLFANIRIAITNRDPI